MPPIVLLGGFNIHAEIAVGRRGVPAALSAEKTTLNFIAAEGLQSDRDRIAPLPLKLLMTRPRTVLLPAVMIRRFESRAVAVQFDQVNGVISHCECIRSSILAACNHRSRLDR